MKLFRVAILMLVLVVAPALTGFAGVRAQSPVKVTWWTETSPKIEDINKYFVEPFNKSHPNIQLEIVPQEKLDDSLRTAIQADSAPDILQTPGGAFIAEYVPAGVVLPMDSYAKQFGWQDKLLPWAYEAGFLENKLYSVPLTYESMVLLYKRPFSRKTAGSLQQRGQKWIRWPASYRPKVYMSSHTATSVGNRPTNILSGFT
jgi:raffinose/stachyose/melibiose transport system substrate-binding protein